MRLLADLVPALRPRMLEKLSTLARAVVEEFSTTLTAEDAALLLRAADLRNDLFHQRFDAAASRLRALGEPPASGKVVKLDLNTGKTGKVSGLNLAQGSMFGWVCESATSGGFLLAIEKLAEATTVLDRLANFVSGAPSAEPPPDDGQTKSGTGTEGGT